MKVSYVTVYDASDIHNWSGSGYNISRSLEKQKIKLDYIGNLQVKLNLILKVKQKLYDKLGQSFSVERDPFVVKQYSRQVEKALLSDTDIIFSPGSLPIALVETNKPKVFYADATFAGMLGFYKEFSNLCSETIRHGNLLEQKALETSQLAIFASDWAAKTAIENYNVDPQKIKVVPFGANITHSLSYKDIANIIARRIKKRCNLLFIGVDWKRKGADLTIEVAKLLNLAGLPTTLHLVGISVSQSAVLPDFVVNHGYISKSTNEGRNIINELFISSHFLIVPSLAEAYGLVYCEANSFGVPAIATDVGGIPTIIKDEINGKTFTLNSSAEDYAKYILYIISCKERYTNLALSSYNEYATRLNWTVAGETVVKHLKNIL